jgi:hypothetical protein
MIRRAIKSAHTLRQNTTTPANSETKINAYCLSTISVIAISRSYILKRISKLDKFSYLIIYTYVPMVHQ